MVISTWRALQVIQTNRIILPPKPASSSHDPSTVTGPHSPSNQHGWNFPSHQLSPLLCRAHRAIQTVCQAYHASVIPFLRLLILSYFHPFNSYLDKRIISYPVSCFLAHPLYTVLADYSAESKLFLKNSIWSDLQPCPNLSNLGSSCQSLSHTLWS